MSNKRKFTGSGNAVFANGKPLPMTAAARRSSPTGFNWGYGGSGPFATAHSILAHLYGPQAADKMAGDFKFQVIAKLELHNDFELPYSNVREWVRRWRATKGTGNTDTESPFTFSPRSE